MTDVTGSAPVSAVVSDLDRTLWVREGELGRSAERAIHTAHAAGLAFLVASGRDRNFLERFGRKYPQIDGMVAENGCVLIRPSSEGPRIERLVDTPDLHTARERLAGAGLPEVDLGDVIVSVRRAEQEEAERLIAGLGIDLVPNVDRLMAVPAGVTKLTGTMTLLDRLGLDPWAFAAIGDAENDLELLARARVSGAPSNAVPRLREMVTYACRGAGPRGVLEFVEHLAESGTIARGAGSPTRRPG